jgi:hypothetical protein
MLHAQSATTATPVRPSALFDFLPTLFGADYVKAEACIYAYAAKYIRDYSGGEWTFNQLPDGAGYLAPEEERVFVSNPDNGFEGEMSGDAAGILSPQWCSITAPGCTATMTSRKPAATT